MIGRAERTCFVTIVEKKNREEAFVGARQKLNTVAISASLILAAVAGCLSGSWFVFIVAAVILLGLSCYSGDIRGGKHGW